MMNRMIWGGEGGLACCAAGGARNGGGQGARPAVARRAIRQVRCRAALPKHPPPPARVPQLGAVVATPLLTQLLLGTLVPVDATALLVSTLEVRRSGLACGVAATPQARAQGLRTMPGPAPLRRWPRPA